MQHKHAEKELNLLLQKEMLHFYDTSVVLVSL